MVIETSVLITIIVTGGTLLGYISRLLFASKCTNCDIGCIHVKRDTAHEKRDISNPDISSHPKSD